MCGCQTCAFVQINCTKYHCRCFCRNCRHREHVISPHQGMANAIIETNIPYIRRGNIDIFTTHLASCNLMYLRSATTILYSRADALNKIHAVTWKCAIVVCAAEAADCFAKRFSGHLLCYHDVMSQHDLRPSPFSPAAIWMETFASSLRITLLHSKSNNKIYSERKAFTQMRERA